ncbi:hypothetical protein IVB22_26875 [Bradyrhizobium sp. 190]|uniref:hypothetical protein n=1 Tax=Bradyrhizobium sp. 190 TaxID=2782658 RepID=UPI001FFBB981|nr:hypothetical protein [Bradyrhizobium sp. 190]MCK1516101.1 hypothetical protein [Bradyrhizobium sp. 190]
MLRLKFNPAVKKKLLLFPERYSNVEPAYRISSNRLKEQGSATHFAGITKDGERAVRAASQPGGGFLAKVLLSGGPQRSTRA